MTKICTENEVFDFMGTGTEERTANGTAVTSLIERVQFGIEKYIGRKIVETSYTISIHDGRYCNIEGNLLFLKNIYYDIVSITTLTEDDTSLTENTDFVIQEPNILERIDASWSKAEQLNIVITGICGLVYDCDGEGTLESYQDIKQIAIEESAIRSGLWSKLIDDGQGNEFVLNKTSLSKGAQERLARYQLPVI